MTRHKTKWVLVLGWTAAASVCTFLLWIPLGAIAGSVGSDPGIGTAPAAMFLYLLYSPFLAPLIIGAVAPGFAVVFWLWGRMCVRHPWIDQGWKPILATAAIMSLPPAAAVAALCARGPLGVTYGDWATWLPFCLAILSGAMVLPRWLVDSLHPGAFAEAHGEAPGA